MKRTWIFALSSFLLLGSMGEAVVTASPASAAQSVDLPGSLLRKALDAPTPPGLKVTLKEMGYNDRTLASPWGSAQYSFRLRDNWLVKEGGYLDVEFSYFFTDLAKRDSREPETTFFGELSSYLDGQLLQTFSLKAATLERTRWRINLPSDLLNERPGAYHEIRLELNAGFMCDTPHQARAVIHPESTLFVDYSLLPLNVDLATYPRPFSQQSFESDQVRFVLPAQPSEAELRAAATIAAGLGSLTGNRIVISTTTDADWLKAVEATRQESEHLVVIGQPSRNQLMAWLGKNVQLPIPMRRRELALSTQGPGSVAPGDTFTFTIAITNTTSAPVSSLSITDWLPRQASLLHCEPACTETSQAVSWKLDSLSPGQVTFLSLALQAASVEQLALPAPVLENMVILANEAQSPINISHLTASVAPASPEPQVSYSQDDHFFLQNEQPVPEGDGILQEIISPWDSQKAILLVTGVNQAAVYKAGQSLGLKTRFPDMKGPMALVRQIQPSRPITRTVGTDVTLADLGYGDNTLYGIYSQEVTYRFYVPLGWQLTRDANVRIFFSHSQVIDERGSTLTVLVNDSPLTSIFLDQENANDGNLLVSLSGARIQPGVSNKLSIQATMQPTQYRCATINPKQAWLKVWQDSQFHLDHSTQNVNLLDLSYFPFPFNTRSDLSDVLFALPPIPRQGDQEALLRLAAALGEATRGDGFSPAVALGESLDTQQLAGYHVIAIGRPTLNPVLQAANSRLPQPFVPGTDEVQYQVGSVLLRLPPNTSLGYLQALASPWNERQTMVAVTGTTDEAIAWGTQVLARQPWRLVGNLALVHAGKKDIEVQSINTRKLTSSGLASAMATAAPGLTPVATLTPPPSSGAASGGPLTPPTGSVQDQRRLPTWVFVFAGIAAVAVLVMLAAGVRKLARQRR